MSAAPRAVPAEPWWLGFDIGGTRLKAGRIDVQGNITGSTIVDTANERFERIWERILDHARSAISIQGTDGLQGVGVALPGLVESGFGSRHLPGKVLGIEGFPLRERLEVELGVPARCTNDGAAAALAEWRFGAARGHDDVVTLTLGTGVGCGVILGGRLLTSRHQGAGVSFGHATIHAGGRTCLCGNIGCAETVVSANAVVGRLREYVARKVPSIVTDRYADDPGSISFATLTDAAQEGDRVALEVLEAFRSDLGATVVTAIHAYDPEVVVLAGGPMAAADAFLPQVQAYVDRYAFRHPKDRRIPVLRAERSDEAGLLGAVALVMQAAGSPGEA
jgi:glucokinase